LDKGVASLSDIIYSKYFGSFVFILLPVPLHTQLLPKHGIYVATAGRLDSFGACASHLTNHTLPRNTSGSRVQYV
jgi:hypothetical protein